MRKTSLSWFLGAGIGIVTLGVFSGGASAQFAQGEKPHVAPSLWHPDSNRQSPSDIGVRAHTNVVKVVLPEANAKPSKASAASGVGPDTVPASGYYFETPSSLACIYGFVTVVTGCNPNTLTQVVTGGSGLAIAIVDAYDNPDAASDLVRQPVWLARASQRASSCLRLGLTTGVEYRVGAGVVVGHRVGSRDVSFIQALSGRGGVQLL
jgi:hypothetical protein